MNYKFAVPLLLAGISTGLTYADNIQFRNCSATPIKVVMDTHRQEFEIAPNGQSRFTMGSGDRPTFHVCSLTAACEVTTGKGVLFSDKYTAAITSYLKWTGSTIKKGKKCDD